MQSSVSLVSYFCDIDSTFRLSDKLFDFRRPLVISDVYDDLYINDSNDDYQFRGKPKKIFGGTDLRNDDSKIITAVNAFLEIRTVLGEQIKNIKEPII